MTTIGFLFQPVHKLYWRWKRGKRWWDVPPCWGGLDYWGRSMNCGNYVASSNQTGSHREEKEMQLIIFTKSFFGINLFSYRCCSCLWRTGCITQHKNVHYFFKKEIKMGTLSSKQMVLHSYLLMWLRFSLTLSPNTFNFWTFTLIETNKNRVS